MLHVLSLGCTLAVLWFLLSGHTEILLLGLGAASIGFVVLACRRMDVIDHESHPVHMGWRLLTYWPWLLWEIIKANWQIAKVVAGPKSLAQPQVFTIAASQRTEVGEVIYANSITLTPGTVTIAAEPGRLVVHALTDSAAADLKTGEMDRKVSALEGAPDAGIAQP